MEEELEGIVQNMIDAGESEENIALVIKSYKSEPLKKKDGTQPQSTSTIKVEKSVSEPTSGSLAIVNPPKIGTKESEKTLKKVIQREVDSNEFKKSVDQKLANYRQATKVSPQEREEAVIELNEVKKQQGILNNIKAMGSQLGNFITTGTFKKDDPLLEQKKQAKEFFAEQKIKPTPQQIEQKADELFVQKKVLAKKQEKINKYLGNLSVDDKIYLKANAQERFSSIPKERKEITDRIALNQDYIVKLSDELKKPMSLEDKNMIESEMDKIAKYLDQDYKQVNKLSKDLGTAQDELDMFKRNYDFIDNANSRIVSSIADIGINTVSGLDYVSNYMSPIGAESRTMQVQEKVEKAREFVQGKREEFRPDSEEITLNNFPQYFTDLLANQSGNLLAIGATGGIGGASVLGLGQAGQTYSDMYKENMKSAKYSPSQMAFAPLLSGVSTGALSSFPTIQTLKNAGNVWKSMLKDTTTKELTQQAVKNTSKNILNQVGKDISKENVTELLDNTIQNIIKRDILDDKSVGYFDNSWQVIKDTSLLTGMLNVGALPQVTMTAVKMFTPIQSNRILDSNGAKIIDLSKQLDNPNLDANTKKLVESQISELTKSSTKIIDETIKKIDGLTDEEVKKVVAYESKKTKLANQAEEVKNNPELTDTNKKVILEGLENEYKNTVEKSKEIIDAETKSPTPKSEIESEAEVQKPTEIKEEVKTPIVLKDRYEQTINIEDIKDGFVLHRGSSEGSIEGFNSIDQESANNYGKNGLVKSSVIKKGAKILRLVKGNSSEYEDNVSDIDKFYKIIGEKSRNETSDWGEGSEPSDITTRLWGNKNAVKKLKDAGIDIVIGNTIDGVDAFIVNKNAVEELKENEATPPTNPPTYGNIRPTTEQVGEVATEQKPTTEVVETESVESTVEPKSNETTVKRVKSIKDSEYDVEFDENDNDVKVTSVKTGKEINKFSVVKNPITGKEKVVKNANYSKIVSDARGEITKSQENTAIKKQFEKTMRSFDPSNEYEAALFALANGAKVSVESLSREVGNLDSRWATNKSAKEKLPSVENLSEQIIADNSNLDLDMQKVRDSIIEIIRSNKRIDQVKQSVLDIYSENTKKQRQQEASAYLSGLTDEEIAIFDSVTAEDDFISELTDEEAIEYFEQQYNVKTEGYEPKSKQINKSEGVKSDSAKKSVGEKEPTRKEIRKKAVEVKIDEIANSVKNLESVFGIKIKADLGDTKTQGISRDQLIDFIAKTAKEIANTGIEIDEAIRTVIDEIKKSFDTDVEVEEVKSKVVIEKEPEPKKSTFEKESGKKSVLSRMAEGENSKSVQEAIEKYELNYEVENQEVAKKNAEYFVKEVGFDKAFSAIKENKITGAEKAFVYNRLLEIVNDKMESEGLQASEETISEYKELFGFITNEFDKESREAGRFISALNNVYNSSMLMYNLSNQIERHKAMGDGTIDEETLAKFKEADENIKRLEKEIKEAEKRANEAEEQLAIKNIEEDIARKKKGAPKTKSQQAKEIANKIRKAKIHKPGIFSSATPGSLAWDGAVEVIAKTIESGGTVADAINKGIEYIRKSKWYQSLADEQKSEAERELRGYIRETTKQPFVSISEDGKIKIPEKIIRDYVEQGITDINDLSKKILKDIIEEYPDVTERQIRDAITRYGKTVNPSPDEIDAQIRKMKRIGKLVSGLEDAYSGKRPLRSGLQRDILTPEERKMQRELKELLRDIPMDEADLQKTWKTALESIKTRLRNQITDLENQIANKEKRKPEKTPIEYDQEAKDLRSKVDSLKQTLDEIVGKPELTEEQKIQKVVNGIEKSIEKLTEQIANKQLEFKKKPSPIVSEEITRLREQQKELRNEILQMRKDAGIVEKRRLELAKFRTQNQITDLQRRINEKDYAKKEITKIIPDDELTKLKAEKLKWQEVYDKDKYKQELKNRTINQRIIDGLFGVWNLPRVVMATGEMSWILIQGGVQSMSILTRNPSQFIGNLRRMIVAMGSSDKANEWERKVKATEIYQIAKDSKLALTEVDHQLDVREEQFLGDYASAIWDLNGLIAEQIVGKKERTLVGDKIKQLFGSKKEYVKTASAREQIKNVNPLRVLERGNTSYMNQLRLNRFIEGVEKLKLEGKDPIKDIEDYKKLAKAINTLTGRANVPNFLKTTDPKVLAAIFFSFRNWVSKLNMLNPLFYYKLGDYKNPSEIFTKKPTVAQKIAISDIMRYITITTSMMYLIQASAGKDDEGEDIISIETDPRSSDFMKMRMGDLRLDPWGGLQSTITFFMRMLTDQTKSTKTGEILSGGEKFGARTRGELFQDYVSGKFNPSAGLIWEYMWTKEKFDENGEAYRENKFGEKFSIAEDVYNLKPMYWEATKEVIKEQPNLYGALIISAGALGINTQVYGKTKEGETSGPPKLPSMPSLPKLPKMP